MNSRTRQTLTAIFARPTRGDLRWSDVETLLEALGCQVTEGSGSRVRVTLGSTRLVLHKPHPEPVLKKGAVDSLRVFLKQCGAKP